MLVELQTFSTTKMKKIYGDDEENDANKGYGFCEINSEMRYETPKDDSGDSTTASASSSSMAGYDRANESLLQLSYAVTLNLMNTLDVDGGWETVAAAAGFNFDQIQQLSFTLTQRNSPTRALLWKLGSLNYTVNDLYETFRIAERIREMQILEAYVKEGGMKGATAKPISPPSSLSSLLSKIKESDKKSQGRLGSSCSMSGSELNFNQPSPVDKAKVIQSKNYEDKIIPGTNQPICHPLMENNANISQSLPSDRPNASPTVFLRDGHQSLPPFNVPCSQMQAEGLISDGIENIPSSGNSFPTSSAIKKSPSHSVASSSLNSDQTLNASSSSRLGNTESKMFFSYRELFNATDGFSKNKLLGEGAFGNVYRGTLNQQECAIKRLYSTATDSKKSDQVKSELSALLKYRHENIVPLYGYAENESELCLVYQYMANGSLEDRLLRKSNTPPLTWERRLNILIGSCKGLNFLHTMGDPPLIHGDIKSANILLDQYFEAKLGDFGQAKYATSSSSTDTTGFTHITVAETSTKLFGTKAYLAPELIGRGTQSVKSDIYALGVVFMEVCSGLKAYDQSRNVGTFLADHFRNEVADKREHVWREQFQDMTLHGVPDNIFIGVLKLALRCVNTAKKARPDTKKLLGEMKLMYIQNQDGNGADVETFSSLSTSLQIDSRNTISSCYLPSNNESHLGGQDTNHVCGPGEQINIRPELQKFQKPPLQKLPGQLRAHVQEPSGQLQAEVASFHSPILAQITAEQRNHPGVDSPPKSNSTDLPNSEAFLLQAAYDRQPKGKIIDRLSGMLLKEENVFEEYPSDPQKLQKIDQFDTGPLNSIPSNCTDFQKDDKEHDSFPQADPKKLAQLQAYDVANFGTSDHSAGDPTRLDCDPLKLAYLHIFDDNLYKQSAERKNCDSNTQQMAVAETRQELGSQKDNLMKTFRVTSDGQAGFPSNTITSANPVMHENGAGYTRSEKVSLESDKDLGFRCTAEHTGSHWPSDDSNNIDVWSPDQDEVPTAQVIVGKPMKQKMNTLFAHYSQLRNAIDGDDDDDDDDGDDCNNK